MKVFGKIKQVVNNLHWPSFKEVVANTSFTVIVTTILALAVSGWVFCVEYIVDWVVSLF